MHERDAAIPVRICRTESRCRPGIGVKTQDDQRRGAPLRADEILTAPPAPAAQPCHGGARHSTSIIARTGNNSNRHLACNLAPTPPTMELREIVCSHQPHKPPLGIAAPEHAERIERVPRTEFSFDRRYLYRRPASGPPGRCEARRERCHPRSRLENISRRDEPPHLIQPQGITCEEGYPPMPPVRGIETAAKQAGKHGFQGRTCPEPRTSHLYVVSPSKATGPRACRRPVAMPISAPNPNSPPSAN